MAKSISHYVKNDSNNIINLNYFNNKDNIKRLNDNLLTNQNNPYLMINNSKPKSNSFNNF